MADKVDLPSNGAVLGIGGVLTLLIAVAVILPMWGCPQYEVYKQGLHGAAKLKEADSSRQIAILEAHAKHEAAKELAKAEIERARGVAEANKIIGEGLKDNHEYLMYLWIQSVGDRDNATIIYVPTEVGLPILEAGRFKGNGKIEKAKK